MSSGKYNLDALCSEQYVLSENPWLLCETKKKKKKHKSKKRKSKKRKKEKGKCQDLSERLIEKAADMMLSTASDICRSYFEKKWKYRD